MKTLFTTLLLTTTSAFAQCPALAVEGEVIVAIALDKRKIYINGQEAGHLRFHDVLPRWFLSRVPGNPDAADEVYFYDLNNQLIASARYENLNADGAYIDAYHITDCNGQALGTYIYKLERKFFSATRTESLITTDAEYTAPWSPDLVLYDDKGEVVAAFTAGKPSGIWSDDEPFVARKPAASPVDPRILVLINALKSSYYMEEYTRQLSRAAI